MVKTGMRLLHGISEAPSKVSQASIYQNSEGIYWLAWNLDVNDGEIWFSSSKDLINWEEPIFIADDSRSPFLYSNTNTNNASLAWATAWDDGYRLYFMDLDDLAIIDPDLGTVDEKLKLFPANPNIAFVEEGERVIFELMAKVEKGTCHNVILRLADGSEVIDAIIVPSVSFMNSGDTQTFTITIWAPHVDDSSSEIRIWVHAQSDEVDSNQELLILVYDWESIGNDESLAGLSNFPMLLGVTLVGVVVSSFLDGKFKKP